MVRRLTRLVLSAALAGVLALGAAGCGATQDPGPAGSGKNVPASTPK